MRESRTYGSVRGAPSNGRPYRNPPLAAFFRVALAHAMVDWQRERVAPRGVIQHGRHHDGMV